MTDPAVDADPGGRAAQEQPLRESSRYHPGTVSRKGDIVYKSSRPCSRTVHSLLRHLEQEGFYGATRVVGSGFDATGRETLSYIEGSFTHPGPWSAEGAAGVGRLLRELHDATATYVPPPDAQWAPWFGRELGGSKRVIGHCDAAPWNIVARQGRPVALIDWETAGPVDPLVDLALAAWLNAKLHDDRVAAREGLPPLDVRARQLRAIADGYRLPRAARMHLVEQIIEVAIHATAAEADEAGILPDTPATSLDPQVLWGLAWRARGAAWIMRHRRVLEAALI